MELSRPSPPLAATSGYYRRLYVCETHRRSPNLVSFSSNRTHSSSSITTGTKASTSSPSSSHFGVSLPQHRHVYRTSSFPKPKRFSVVAGVFEKFTERAVKVVMFSQREAKALGEDMVLTQHLLLGLVAEDRAPGGFLGSGITIDAARGAVRSLWRESNRNDGDDVASGPPQSETSATNMPFAASTKRVFEAAVEYSRTMGHNFIAPEHIAVGLFTVDDGKANRVLKRFGVNMNYLAAVAVARLHMELAKEGRELDNSAFKKSGKVTQARFQEKTKEKKALEKFCVDLTTRASKGLIDPVIGRETEVQRIIQILCRRTKSNPILLGEAGVGKTAIAEGLALNIADRNVPSFLMKKRILSLDVGLLIAGAKERGELELRVTTLLKEIKKSGNIILFIDEVHTLIGSGIVSRGGKGSGLDIANLLKPSLGRGEIQCIASTTMDEFRVHFEKDKALARRFQPVFIDEPNKEDAVEILRGLREKYETYHKCRYTFEAINAAVYLSERYIPDRYLPDKAIDLIDEAGSRACMEASKRRKENQTSILSKSPSDYWQEIRAVQAMHEKKLEEDEKLNANHILSSSSLDDEVAVIGPEEIAAIASFLTGIPVKKLTSDERMLLVGLHEHLKKRVIGQDEAISAICRAVKRSRVGLNDPDRPIAAMLFCGPTGVGKTELAKALAATYFGSESAMLRLDMSEYMERHSVSKLIGSPPGYLGYGEGGTLTEAIRKQPFTVVLLDEIEKAHRDIFNILLQMFEDGHLTDSQGRRVSFKNALVVMTSNVGSDAMAKGRYRKFGFFLDEDDSTSYSGMKSLLLEELKAYFSPELLNRIDEIVVFKPLEKPQMLEILDTMLSEVKQRLIAFEISLEVSEAVKEMICECGYDKSYGARPLRRAVTQIIEDPLSESLLSGNYKKGDTAVIHLDDSGNPIVTNRSNERLELSDTTTML